MKAKMAEGSEYFSIGSIVACKTCYQKEIVGEVLAFDPQTKMLILKCPSSSGKPTLNDIHVVNLGLVSEVVVREEVGVSSVPGGSDAGSPNAPNPTLPTPAPSISLQRLSSRTRNQVEEKRRYVAAVSAGVSGEGQSLFLAITKTIDEVIWNGQNIVVMNQVTITPPYKPENVKSNTDSKALNHVRKIVEKHVKDHASPETSMGQLVSQ